MLCFFSVPHLVVKGSSFFFLGRKVWFGNNETKREKDTHREGALTLLAFLY